jgi:AcrR family transcriptional regulator
MAKASAKQQRQSASSQGDAAARPRNSRVERSAATRDAILAAAHDEFVARGFAAARLDDVARRAGVAKGTIYVHFRDKVSLFEELVRSELVPVIVVAESAPMADLPLRVFAERLVDTFVREIYGTRRRDVLRLIITEGERFPQLADIYYREVVARAIKTLRAVVRRAVERGEIGDDALLHFPQLLVAPGLVAVIWDALFARFEPLDVAAMMRKHLELLFAALERRGK